MEERFFRCFGLIKGIFRFFLGYSVFRFEFFEASFYGDGYGVGEMFVYRGKRFMFIE